MQEKKYDPQAQWFHLEEVTRVMGELGERHQSWYLEIEELAVRYFDGVTARMNYRILYTILNVVSWRLEEYPNRCFLPRNMEEWPDADVV